MSDTAIKPSPVTQLLRTATRASEVLDENGDHHCNLSRETGRELAEFIGRSIYDATVEQSRDIIEKLDLTSSIAGPEGRDAFVQLLNASDAYNDNRGEPGERDRNYGKAQKAVGESLGEAFVDFCGEISSVAEKIILKYFPLA